VREEQIIKTGINLWTIFACFLYDSSLIFLLSAQIKFKSCWMVGESASLCPNAAEKQWKGKR